MDAAEAVIVLGSYQEAILALLFRKGVFTAKEFKKEQQLHKEQILADLQARAKSSSHED